MAKFRIKDEPQPLRDSQIKYLEDKEKRPLSKYEMVQKGYGGSLRFSSQKEMAKSTIAEFTHGSRYRDVQEVPGKRRKKYGEMGPQVYIPPQWGLYSGAMVWTRDYRSPVDVETLQSTKTQSDADLSTMPAHLLAIYSNPTREEKRMEIYQFEDISDKIVPRPVSADERRQALIGSKRYYAKPEELKELPIQKQMKTSELRNSGSLEDRVKLDLMERGMTVEPGNRFGGLFIARDNLERDPKTGAKLRHSSWTIGVVPEKSEVPYWMLTGATRIARDTKKQYIIAIVGDKGKVRYIGLDRIGGGKNTPRMHRKVIQKMYNAGIKFERGFWKETAKDPKLQKEINNLYFAGPSDFHKSREEKKDTWARWYAKRRKHYDR